jgi:uncharacterized protein YjdB
MKNKMKLNLVKESLKDKSSLRKFLVTKTTKPTEIKVKIKQKETKSIFTRMMDLKRKRVDMGDRDVDRDIDMDRDRDMDVDRDVDMDIDRDFKHRHERRDKIKTIRNTENIRPLNDVEDVEAVEDGIVVVASGFDKNVDSNELVLLFQTFGEIGLFTMLVDSDRVFQGTGIFI